jgi:hypothetical protein
MSTKTIFVTVGLIIHYICLLIFFGYLIPFIVYNEESVETDLPRCAGESFFERGREGRTWGKIQSTGSYYEARFEVMTVLLVKIRVFWDCELLDPEYEGTMMLGNIAF